MKIFCTYHPTKPALWLCPQCNANSCADCISNSTTQAYGITQVHNGCPKCNARAQALAVGNVIEPFWKRLPKIFLYPFHLRFLVLIVVLAP